MSKKIKYSALFLFLLSLSFLLDLRPASAAPVFVTIRPAFVKFATQPTPISPAYPDTCFNIAWWLELIPVGGGNYNARMTLWQAQENCHTGEAINVYEHNAWMQMTSGSSFCGISTEGVPSGSLKVRTWNCSISFPASGRVVTVRIKGWAGSNTFNSPNYDQSTYPFLLTP